MFNFTTNRIPRRLLQDDLLILIHLSDNFITLLLIIHHVRLGCFCTSFFRNNIHKYQNVKIVISAAALQKAGRQFTRERELQFVIIMYCSSSFSCCCCRPVFYVITECTTRREEAEEKKIAVSDRSNNLAPHVKLATIKMKKCNSKITMKCSLQVQT